MSVPAVWRGAKTACEEEGGRIMKGREPVLFSTVVVLFILTNPAQAYRQVIDLRNLSGEAGQALFINSRDNIVVLRWI